MRGNTNTTEEVRDKALTTAFSVYDAFGEYLQPQNAATFVAYMIQVVDKFIPPSLTRGNMGLALYKAACEEGVVDDSVLEAMKGLQPPSEQWGGARRVVCEAYQRKACHGTGANETTVYRGFDSKGTPQVC